MPITSTGRKLIARGFEGSKADWVAHVCFDSYYFSSYKMQAPCIFFYRPGLAAEIAKNKEGVSGSRAGASEQGTGFGAKIAPSELQARARQFTPDPAFAEMKLGDRGVAEVRKLYERGGWAVRDATLKEQQVDKIDLVAENGLSIRRIEVKARGLDKAFPNLFIQTHEANPDKRIS